MKLLINAPGRDISSLVNHLTRLQPDLSIEIWPDVERPDKVDAVICWRQQPGDLLRYPRLKLIASLGAGVDHILDDPLLPANIPVTRLLDPSLAEQMSQYLLNAIEMEQSRRDKSLNQIAILGAGQLASHAAQRFTDAGYQVSCWGRHERYHYPFEYYSGRDGLTMMLAKADVLICLLPLTPETENLLNLNLFSQIKPGCFLINAARGRHLVEEDLLVALDKGWLSGACLDVHSREPGPPDLRLLIHPAITMTRHTAAISDMERLAQQVIFNLENLQSEMPLIGEVEREIGY